jgi:DNA-binding FrmR family transcriptional regulator
MAGGVPYPIRVGVRAMSHTTSEKIDLVNRTKKIIGQLEAVLRALNDDEQCAEMLQRLSAARGAINSLMGELMEDHIRNHMPRNSKSSEEAADDLIGIVRTYLK